MSMMMRRGMMVPAVVPGGLPAEYLAVQYLESDGNQFIYTDVPWRLEFDAEAEFMPTANQDSLLFGAQVRRGAASVGNFGSYNGRLQIFYPNYGYFDIGTSGNRYMQTIGTKYHAFSSMKQGLQTATINGDVLLDRNTTITEDVSNPYGCFSLFGLAYPPNQTYPDPSLHYQYKGRIYSLKLSSNGTLFADFIPCIRIVDSKPGMYDLVGRQFYVNAGTGEFVAGLAPELSDTDFWSIAGYFNAGGNIVANPGYLMCDYQPIISGNTYTLNTAGNTWKGLAYYDEQYNTLDFSQNANYTTPITLTAPSNSKYYRAYFGTDSTGIKFELVNPT